MSLAGLLLGEVALLGARLAPALLFLVGLGGGHRVAIARRPRAEAAGSSARRTARPARTTTRSTEPGPRTRRRTRRSRHALLRLLDEDAAPGEHLPVPLFDCGVGLGVAGELHEGEAARPLGLAIERDAHALDDSS